MYWVPGPDIQTRSSGFLPGLQAYYHVILLLWLLYNSLLNKVNWIELKYYNTEIVISFIVVHVWGVTHWHRNGIIAQPHNLQRTEILGCLLAYRPHLSSIYEINLSKSLKQFQRFVIRSLTTIYLCGVIWPDQCAARRKSKKVSYHGIAMVGYEECMAGRSKTQHPWQ